MVSPDLGNIDFKKTVICYIFPKDMVVNKLINAPDFKLFKAF